MRIVIAEDSALLREGLVGLLERQGHEVVAQAASATELEAVVDRTVAGGEAPDVIVTDVRMPPTMTADGLDAAVRIRARHPQIAIMVLSQYVAPGYAAELFGDGARSGSSGAMEGEVGGLGYLLKERVARVADFLRSLSIVVAGGVVIDPEIATLLVSGRRTALDALTHREREVLELMARGLSNTQIAEQLVLSAGAVSKHVANIFGKLGLATGEENRRVRAVLAYLTAQQK
ncbi:DNA-binding NarL/FixJ family response regulator [Kineosphaera limosa]|uniref:Putative two-component response regulator n=1 Tax=Kineosphaera limosa NBRC 100340 TaxID=1184609 RepID=K6WW34_9MICO|nr:response regulator transcription factor [Kineosphaera limosa]NYE01680.1 DNA-binding NarL/FixJ family response regulator [Kineosphaera limosa]GAB98046.1 putative two-component response regulator [Kineosphaera limosa NBRC 100340]